MDSKNRPEPVPDCSNRVKNVGRVVIVMCALTMIGSCLQLGTPVMGEMGPFLHASAISFICCGVWGIGTGIGLLRAWRWARISMLAFSCLLATLGTLCVATFVFMPNGDVSSWSLVLLKWFSFLFALIPTGLGALCVIYFTRSNVKAYFEASRKIPAPFV